MKLHGILIVIFCMSLFGLDHKWVVPWVAMSDSQWNSDVVITNIYVSPVGALVRAYSTTGEMQQLPMMDIAHWSQQTVPMVDFNTNVLGNGFALVIESDNSQLSVGAKVSSINTTSGDSPGIYSGIYQDQWHTSINFPYTKKAGGTIPALVVFNPSENTVLVHFWGSDEQGNIWHKDVTVGSNQPYADLMVNIFPNAVGEMEMVNAYTVDTVTKICGAVFSFNSQLEPSVTAAKPIISIPEVK